MAARTLDAPKRAAPTDGPTLSWAAKEREFQVLLVESKFFHVTDLGLGWHARAARRRAAGGRRAAGRAHRSLAVIMRWVTY